MHHPTDRIITTTAFVKPVVEHWLEREIALWVHHMKDRSDDPSHHERTLLPRSYVSPHGVTESLFIYLFYLFIYFFKFFLEGADLRLGSLEVGIAMIFSPSHLLCTIKSQMGGSLGGGGVNGGCP